MPHRDQGMMRRMPYIILVSDGEDGSMTLCERVGSADFEAEHFRRCLADRLAWAAQDAEREATREPQREITTGDRRRDMATVG
jgi:hypothetical protein